MEDEPETIMFVSTEAGLKILKEFVAEVLVVCANDLKEWNGHHITWGLEDKALQAGIELGMTEEELNEIQEKA